MVRGSGWSGLPGAPTVRPWRPTRPSSPPGRSTGAEQWGLLANRLEDQGVPFPDSERRAFDQVKAEMEVRAL